MDPRGVPVRYLAHARLPQCAMTAGIGKKTLRDVDVAGKRVLVRAALNVPLEDGRVADDTRIREPLPTVQYLLGHRAPVVLCSHPGRPKGVDASLSLRPVAGRLGALLGKRVAFTPDCVGPDAEQAARGVQAGSVLLLENLRFHPEEEANDANFARQLASLGELFV